MQVSFMVFCFKGIIFRLHLCFQGIGHGSLPILLKKRCASVRVCACIQKIIYIYIYIYIYMYIYISYG